MPSLQDLLAGFLDTLTGHLVLVAYLLASHDLRTGTGLSVLVDRDGRPVVTPLN